MGSTFGRKTGPLRIWDHPHIHGEHSSGRKGYPVAWGSPPYTWGALSGGKIQTQSSGITPIYMGSTVGIQIPVNWLKDHPHIHGEHPARPHWWLHFGGSPPYTWGARGFWDPQMEA